MHVSAVWLFCSCRVVLWLFRSICRIFFFKQKTAYEMRISDWSSDVCSSDLVTAVTKIRRRVPVEQYLKPQKRFAHLFAGAGRADLIARIQADADRNIARFGLLADAVSA